MLYSFFKYFASFIFKSKQWALMLSLLGLIISAFSLLTLQAIMGGLQDRLMYRAKSVQGEAVLYLDISKGEDHNKFQLENLTSLFLQRNLKVGREYQMEAVLKKEETLLPVTLHALDFGHLKNLPQIFQEVDLTGLILPYHLALKFSVMKGDFLTLVSMGESDFLMTEIPRMKTFPVSETITTEVPELDVSSVWADIKMAQALTRSNLVNVLRFYSHADFSTLKQELLKMAPDAIFKTWEEENNTLVFALKLENFILVFLFIGMTLLVSLCISSGLMLFFRSISLELASFWIMGASRKKLIRASGSFLHILSFLASFLGIALALAFLYFLSKYSGNIMPEVFVERKLPIRIELISVLISFFIPYIMSLIFSYLALNDFRKKQDFLRFLRAY